MSALSPMQTSGLIQLVPKVRLKINHILLTPFFPREEPLLCTGPHQLIYFRLTFITGITP
ncbi:hypothetical protein ROA7745_00829 [Roseovarius aestuarii]|uniref:Uncharacterized protein n=1 Tax=Roseovarius aestuarii TaxID=475083 RepID=A0A1X7BNC8_9RHOB|nr:hypothetical protein ROA7745_00829 [Roseovarius aestuarii]